MRLLRLGLILLGVAAWIGSVPLIFRLAESWRLYHDGVAFSHDGQAAMDVFAYAICACLIYILLTLAALLLWEWRRHRKRR
jgi:hypothetical protein